MIKSYTIFLESNKDIEDIPPFYIFGSEDSTDYDVVVSVKYIPQNVDEAHNICKDL